MGHFRPLLVSHTTRVTRGRCGVKSVVVGTAAAAQAAFVGPFGVGKTTALRTACGATAILSEARTSGSTMATGRHLKPNTTVGLEIGDWVSDGQRVTVVGTPGQARFDAVRRSVMPRSTAIVLWLFGHHEKAALDTELWLEHIISEGVPPAKLTLAITRLADPSAAGLKPFREVAAQWNGAAITAVAADPRNRDDVDAVLRTALGQVADRSLQKAR